MEKFKTFFTYIERKTTHLNDLFHKLSWSWSLRSNRKITEARSQVEPSVTWTKERKKLNILWTETEADV